MEVRNNGTRFLEYRQWENCKYRAYDYGKDGLLKYIMSPVFLKTLKTYIGKTDEDTYQKIYWRFVYR